MTGDIWTKTFKKYYKELIGEKLNNIRFTQKDKLNYFATFNINSSEWKRYNEHQVQDFLRPYEDQIDHFVPNKTESILNAIKLGSVIVNVS